MQPRFQLYQLTQQVMRPRFQLYQPKPMPQNFGVYHQILRKSLSAGIREKEKF